MMRSPKVAILTHPQFRSPRFLAESLKRMLGRLGVRADIFLNGVDLLTVPQKPSWGPGQALQAARSKRALSSLRDYDLFVVSDAIGAFRDEVDVSVLRRLGKPVLMYEVFFVPGAKHWLDRLPVEVFGKFDGYLSVSGIHGCRPACDRPMDVIGLDLQPRQPFLKKKSGFSVLVDFPRQGYEDERRAQLEALRQLDVQPVFMEGEYTFDEIEEVYRTVSATFVSFPEAFGVPIAQLQQYGAFVLSPERMWVMRHALLEPGSVFFDIKEPPFTGNFRFYLDVEELCDQLTTMRGSYDPMEVAARFVAEQPAYSQGDLQALWTALRRWL